MTVFFKKYRREKKKRAANLFSLGTISIVLIVALGLLGAGYASWTQQFTIFSSISTGEINVEIRDVLMESSDGYQSISFNAHKDAEDVVDQVNMDVVTNANPFSSVVVFLVENNGTIPVICVGIDQSSGDGLEMEIVDAPSIIDVGDTEPIKVRITKGYCEDFQFSALLEFEQTMP